MPPPRPLLPLVAQHPLASVFPAHARAFSDTLRSAVNPGTLVSYSSGFQSLVDFCSTQLLGRSSPLPVDSFTLCTWAVYVTHHPSRSSSHPILPSSVRKYISGIRFQHLLHGFPWTLGDSPEVVLCLRALEMEFPETVKRLKVPLSVSMMLSLCARIPFWPHIHSLTFDDLVWVTVSAIAHGAALRGGEIMVRPGGTRPVLRGHMLSVVTLPGSVGTAVRVQVPRAKTSQTSDFQEAFALDSRVDFPLNPSPLFRAYRAAAVRLGIDVCGNRPAFRLRDGSIVSRAFMVNRASELAVAAGVRITDSRGVPIRFVAASWRAGYVLSARSAGVDEFTIRTHGRWRSSSGPEPYSFASTVSLQTASQRMVDFALANPRAAMFQTGIFSSESVFEQSS